MSTIDLHCHSTASDGKDTPEELVQKAQERGINLLSLTDHDTVDGLGAAEAEAKALKVKFVSGLELAVTYFHPLYQGGHDPIRLHLLGYGFDYHDSKLLHELQRFREYRRYRIVEIFKNINMVLESERKPTLDLDKFRDYERTVDGTIGRPHLGQFLVNMGVVASVPEAFDLYLHRCYVPTLDVSLVEGSALIRNAHGKVILAHPAGDKVYSLLKVSSEESVQAQLLRDMKPHLDGIEVFYPAHSLEKRSFFQERAKELDLMTTGGSDHHGGERDTLGKVEIPEFVARYFL